MRDELLDGWNIVTDFYLFLLLGTYLFCMLVGVVSRVLLVGVAEMWYKMAFS